MDRRRSESSRKEGCCEGRERGKAKGSEGREQRDREEGGRKIFGKPHLALSLPLAF